MVTTLAGSPGIVGAADGTGSAASFNGPSGIAADGAGNVYVADSGNNTIRKITPAGVVTTLAGSPGLQGYLDGAGTLARFYHPVGVAADSAGNVYVTDGGNTSIRKITPAGLVTTLAGSPGAGGPIDGIGSAAKFWSITGIAVDVGGNVYVSDALVIRKITPTGVVTTLAGSPSVVGAADGLGSSASFNNLGGIAADGAGNLYVADIGNSTIRKITPGGMVTTAIGTAGQYGFSPGNLPGMLRWPNCLAISGTTMYATMQNSVVRVTNLP